MKVRSIARALTLALLAFLFLPGLQAQDDQSVITKREALNRFSETNDSELREIISDEARFRVVFPGKPEIDDDVITVRGFRLRARGARWVVSYSDLDLPRSVTSEELRERYHKANQAAARSGQLVSERDVFLNGRLGSEVVIRNQDELTRMRSFISGKRVFIIAVITNETDKARSQIDDDIKQFFESFTFWDRV